MKKVYIETNGCAVLRHDTYKIAKYIEENGFKEIDNAVDADYIIITGCAVIDINEDYIISVIQKLYNENKNHAKIIVAGCISTIASERIEKISKDIIQISNDNTDEFDKYFFNIKKIKDLDFNISPKRHHSKGDPSIIINEEEEKDKLFAMKIDELTGKENGQQQFKYSTRGRHLWREPDLYEIKVSSGCTGKCSYCATKLAIGDLKSIEEKRILEQVKEAKKNGYKKIMLMGDEIGGWHDNKKDIVDLINDILSIDPDFKIGIRYIQPDIIVKIYDRIKMLLKNGSIFYFCVAIQSGSSRILKMMNRNPNIQPFISCMQDIIKNKYPVLRHTQIIVGFPSETEKDLLDTIDVLQKTSFDHVVISAYSRRKGTKVYELEPISSEIINKRMEILNDWLELNRNSKIYTAIRDEFYDFQN